MRHREYIAAAAWPYLPGEPGAMTDVQINSLEGGTGHTSGTYSCNDDNGAGVTLGPFTSNDLAGDSAGGGIHSFITGSLETSQCVSRFGAQDLIGNVGLWMSDQLSGCTAMSVCSGASSGLDSGNTDLSGFQFNGTQWPGGTAMTTWTTQNGAYSTTSFSLPLGLPLVTNDGSSFSLTSLTAKLHNDVYYMLVSGVASARPLIVGGQSGSGVGGGRWLSGFNFGVTGSSNIIGFRCAVPAY